MTNDDGNVGNGGNDGTAGAVSDGTEVGVGAGGVASGGEHLRIFDTTLRDGEQAPGIALTKAEKVEIAEQLARLNVDIIEAGFPIASPADSEATRQVAREVRRPVIAALARCRPLDIEEAARALEPAER